MSHRPEFSSPIRQGHRLSKNTTRKNTNVSISALLAKALCHDDRRGSSFGQQPTASGFHESVLLEQNVEPGKN